MHKTLSDPLLIIKNKVEVGKTFNNILRATILDETDLTAEMLNTVIKDRAEFSKESSLIEALIARSMITSEEGYKFIVKALCEVKFTYEIGTSVKFSLIREHQTIINNVLDNYKNDPYFNSIYTYNEEEILDFITSNNYSIVRKIKSFPDNSFIGIEEIIVPYGYFDTLNRKYNLSIDYENLVIDLKKTDVITEENIFNRMLDNALKCNASDIHIVPHVVRGDITYKVYFRINGIFYIQNQFIITRQLGESLIKLLKNETSNFTFGDFNPNDQLRAQGGRILKDNVDIRIEFCPDGLALLEDVTMRVIQCKDSGSSIMKYNKYFSCSNNPMNILNEDYDMLMDMCLNANNGLILISGVTNSGKTTLVHHLLDNISEKSLGRKKIGTIEDPIEHRFFKHSNIIQHQISEKRAISGQDKIMIKMGFGDYVRSFKRGDYNIIFVGEWRNEEGLSKAMLEQSAAGQLIFTTLHIRDSFEVYYILEKVFGVTPDICNLIIMTWNQILVPILCNKCKFKIEQKTKTTFLSALQLSRLHDEEKKILKDLPQAMYVKNPEGCEYCNFTGYVGRVPIYYYFVPTPYFKTLYLKGDVTPVDIHKMVLKSELLGKTKAQCLEKYILEHNLLEHIDSSSIKMIF